MPRTKKLSRAQQTALTKIRSENIGRLLMLSFRRFEEIIVDRVRCHGFTDIRQAHASLIRHIDIDGSRLTEVAHRAGLHKQAAGQLTTEVEALGYIRRVADPTDRRASLVKFTSKGRALLGALPKIHKETHDALAKIIGTKGIGSLMELLSPIAEEQRRREQATSARTSLEKGPEKATPALSARGKRRGRKPGPRTKHARAKI